MTRPAGVSIAQNPDVIPTARVIYLGVPSFGMVSLRWHAHLMQLQNPLNRSVFHAYAIGYEVGQARNYLVQQALAFENDLGHTVSHVFFIDDDCLVPPYALAVLLQRNRPIVGGLYYAKTSAEQPLVLLDKYSGTPTSLPQNAVVDCYAHGMGCTLVELRVFRELLEQGLVDMKTLPNGQTLPQWFATTRDALDTGHNGAPIVFNQTEDVFFLEQAAKLGYTGAVDTGVFCFHYDAKADQCYPLRLAEEFRDHGTVTIGAAA